MPESHMVMLLAFLITGSILSKTNLSLGYFFFKENIFSHRPDINVAFVLAAERGLFYMALVSRWPQSS